jgi:nucleoside-diphosphate kinase
MFYLDHPSSETFFKPYKGILPEHWKVCEVMTEGPCVAVEVHKGNKNCVDDLRGICGPYDPYVAKKIKENTIRAQFGLDRCRNAVHCTDLDADAILECEFFFKVL